MKICSDFPIGSEVWWRQWNGIYRVRRICVSTAWCVLIQKLYWKTFWDSVKSLCQIFNLKLSNDGTQARVKLFCSAASCRQRLTTSSKIYFPINKVIMNRLKCRPPNVCYDQKLLIAEVYDNIVVVKFYFWISCSGFQIPDDKKTFRNSSYVIRSRNDTLLPTYPENRIIFFVFVCVCCFCNFLCFLEMQKNPCWPNFKFRCVCKGWWTLCNVYALLQQVFLLQQQQGLWWRQSSHELKIFFRNNAFVCFWHQS